MLLPVPFNSTVMLVPSHTELLAHTSLCSMTPLHLSTNHAPIDLENP